MGDAAHHAHSAFPDDERARAAAWTAAAAQARVRAALESIYTDVAAAIESRGPACWASGRCCNFEKAGHRLYVTGLEAAYTVVGLRQGTGPALTRASLDAALARGGCPFQVDNLCGVHVIKPLACRVYFCDRSAQDWQRELSERMHERVRAVHGEHAIEYRYAEWRSLLSMFVEAGLGVEGAGGDSGAGRVPLRVLPKNAPS